MDLIQALILGIVQGLTEYLPISSSAHLVLVPKLLGWSIPGDQAFVFNVLVQLGTLAGVLAYFAKDLLGIAHAMFSGLMAGKPLKTQEARLGWLVGLATVPAAMAGIFLKSHIETFFHSPKAVAAFLMATAGILTVAEFLSTGSDKRGQIKFLDAVVIGFSQMLALLPGLSRSGVTISTAVILGLSKESAARFSFLMSIPIISGACLITFQDLWQQSALLNQMLYPILVGWLTAACVGYGVIYWFLKFLKSQSLLWFALYCGLLGGLTLLAN